MPGRPNNAGLLFLSVMTLALGQNLASAQDVRNRCQTDDSEGRIEACTVLIVGGGPNLEIYHYYRGRAWLDKGELDRAIADLRQAVKIDPKFALAVTTLKIAESAKAQLASERKAKQKPLLSEAAKKVPTASEARQQEVQGPGTQDVPGRSSTMAIALEAGKLGKRVALVVANSRYRGAPSLQNPARDADLIAAAFRSLGFADVRVLKDATKAQLLAVLAEFSDRASGSDWAVVYYAGHGIELDGQNYLVPTDANLKRDQHVRLEAVSLDDVLESASGASKVRLVILDACRDNPFLAKMSRANTSRSLSRGLANIEPQKGVLVAYAAKHGQVAADGNPPNSPFATALINHINEPNLDIGLLFRKVRDSVLAMTNNEQEPYVYGSLPGQSLTFAPTK